MSTDELKKLMDDYDYREDIYKKMANTFITNGTAGFPQQPLAPFPSWEQRLKPNPQVKCVIFEAYGSYFIHYGSKTSKAFGSFADAAAALPLVIEE